MTDKESNTDRPRYTPAEADLQRAIHKLESHVNSPRKLPEGATETLVSFDEPGFIRVTINPPGATAIFNLEEVVNLIECDAYNEALLYAWQRVFAKLAETCRRKLPAHATTSLDVRV